METVSRSELPDRAQHRQAARRGLLVFGLLMLPFSLFGYWFYAMAEAHGFLFGTSLPIMLAPALAACLTRLFLREGFANVGFTFSLRTLRLSLLLALVIPLGVGALAYSLASIAGLVRFEPPMFPFLPAGTPALLHFLVMILLTATLGTLVLLPTAAGEELGWRGYLLPQLIDADVPQPILLSGIIWGLWHLAPVFTAGYAAGPSAWLSALCLMIAIPSFGTILAWMRLDTGSIWPCVVAHAAWNAIINGGFDLAVQGEDSRLWVGESGVFVVLILGLTTLGIGIIRRRSGHL